MKYSSLILFIASTNFVFVTAATTCENVEGLSGCACRFSNGLKPISLQDLVGNNTDGKPIRFKTKTSNDWSYAYHPCGTFNMFMDIQLNTGDYGCRKASAGRFTDRSARQCEGLGDLTGAKFEVHETFEYPIASNLTVTFVNATSAHAARISLVCDRSLTKKQTEFKFVNVTEGPIEFYDFSLAGPCSCPGGCDLKVPKPSSAVSIYSFFFLVIPTSLALVYFNLN